MCTSELVASAGSRRTEAVAPGACGATRGNRSRLPSCLCCGLEVGRESRYRHSDGDRARNAGVRTNSSTTEEWGREREEVLDPTRP